jgi:hypothetical protein
MSAKRADPLDDLYRAHPGEFVAARNELAKELRADGEREEADRVKKLKRPSAAAWLLNLIALAQPKVFGEFAKASAALEKAQARALEGGDPGKWRQAAAREREAAQAVLDAAEAAADDAGHPATKQALDLADGTLRAAAADPELRERVVAGRLEREQTGATLGTAGLIASPEAAEKTAKRREAKQAKRDVERLEQDLSEAEELVERRGRRVGDTAEALKRAKSQLKEAERDAADLRKRLKSARGKA